MKVWYSTNFIGHRPVGVAAVVVAETKEDAFQCLKELLSVEGLTTSQVVNFKDTFTADCVEELPTNARMAVMLCSGNY